MSANTIHKPFAVSATVEATGEILTHVAETPEQLIDSLAIVNAYIDAYEKVKKQLKARADKLIEADTYEHGDWLFRRSSVQRQTYDPLVLREVIPDEDTLAGFYKLQKGVVDDYIAEHLGELGEGSSRLRSTMVPDGPAYQVVKLERLTRKGGK